MTDFVSDGQPFETPSGAAAEGYAATPPSFGAGAAALYHAASSLEPVSRFVERSEYDTTGGLGGMLGRALAVAGEGDTMLPPETRAALPGMTPQPSPTLTADQANARYAPIGADGKPAKITDAPMPEAVAQLVGKAKADEIERDGVIARFENAHSWPVNFATGTAAFLLDPLNAATAFLPGFGEEAVTARLGGGFMARTAGRMVSGATGGAIAQAPLTALRYGLSGQEGDDYSLRDAFRDMAFSAAGGAIMQAGFGAVGDALRARRGIAPGAPGVAAGEQVAEPLQAAPIVPAASAPTAPAAVASGNEARLVLGSDAHGDFFRMPIEGGGEINGTVSPDRSTFKVAASVADRSGEGFGTSAYAGLAREVLARGAVLESDTTVSGAAARVYEKLRALGFTVERNPYSAESQKTPGRLLGERWVYRVTGYRMLDSAAAVLGAPATATADGKRSAVSEILDGRPVDVAPIFPQAAAPPAAPGGIPSTVFRGTGRAGMLTADGGLSVAGRRRIEAALLAKAYDDPSIVAAITEDPDSNIKALGRALTEISAPWAAMRREARTGVISPAVDVTRDPGLFGASDVVSPLEILRHARPGEAAGPTQAGLFEQPDRATAAGRRAVGAGGERRRSVGSQGGPEAARSVGSAAPRSLAAVAQQQRELYRGDFAPGIPAPEMQATVETVYGPRAETAAAVASLASEADRKLAEAQTMFAATGAPAHPDDAQAIQRAAEAMDEAQRARSALSEAGACLSGGGE